MFDIEKAKIELKRTPEALIEHIGYNKELKLSVSNFAWTEEVEQAFYKHPKHRYFVKKWKNMERNMSWGMWCLNSLPSIIK